VIAGDVNAWINEDDPYGDWAVNLGSALDPGASPLTMSWEEAERLAAWITGATEARRALRVEEEGP